MHKRVSRAFIHLSWYALVSVIVTSSVLISLIWLTSSSIDDLRPKILDWVEESTGQPINVESLAIEWEGIIPHLKLSEIEVKDRNTLNRLTHFKEADLSFDLYHSVINKAVTVGHLTLSGLDLDLLHKKDGSISLLGLTEQSNTDNNGLYQWLLKQPVLEINNSRVAWHEEVQQINKIQLEDVGIKLVNNTKKNTHFLSGSGRLSEQSGKLSLFAKVSGNPLSADWNATVKFNTQEIKIDKFIPQTSEDELKKYLDAENISLDQSRLNSEIKIHFSKARLKKFDGQFALKNVAPIYSISSNFTATHTNNARWKVAFPNVKLASLEGPWKTFSMKLNLPSAWLADSNLEFKIDNLHIENLLTILPNNLKNQLKIFQPSGVLNKLKAMYQNHDTAPDITLNTEFNHLSTIAHQKVPGVNNLSGSLFSDGESISLNIDSHDLQVQRLTKNGENELPILLDHFNGAVQWQQANQGWQVKIPKLNISDNDLEFQLSGTVKKSADRSPELDLNGRFFNGNAEPIVKMIPENLLHPKTNEWLDRSIVSGQLTGGSVIFKGFLDQFPFKDQEGFFEVRLNAEDGVLDYFPDWPKIENIIAEVVFDSEKMIITTPTAMINQTEVSNVTVEIPELNTKQHRLLIKGKAGGQIKDGIGFLNSSPLKNSIGKQFDHLKLTGPLDLDLKLDIPLSDAETSKVEGIVHLNKNDLLISSLDIQLNDLTGDFHFDRNRWKSDKLKARLYESAVQIDLDIDKTQEKAKSKVKLTGFADKNYVTNRLIQVGVDRDQLNVLNAISGTTTWEAILDLPDTIGAPDEETGLLIRSQLQGLKINAPHPLGKGKSESNSLLISTTLSKKLQRDIRFKYSDVVRGQIHLSDNQDERLKHINLNFGKTPKAKSLKSNFLINAFGEIDKLDFTTWSNFLSKHYPESPDGNSHFSKDWISFDLSINKLLIGTQRFDNNHVSGINSTKSWELQFKNKEINGMFSVPYDLKKHAVKADFETLKIITDDTKKTSVIDPELLPEIFLSSQNFQYNDLKLGSVQLHAKPINKGISIEKLITSSSSLSMDIQGSWKKEPTHQNSSFHITALSPSLGLMLDQLGFGTNGIVESEAKIELNTTWDDSPTNFQLDKLNGDLSIIVGPGRLTEIKNRIGKIFGLLSIQSLGRRLSFNFNDILKEGFSFDNISGHFDIDHGHAYTNNLRILAPSASILLTGSIGLATQKYDQLITVTPSVSDSLPVASALFGPVGAGVGAAILLAEKIIPVIPDTIDKVLEQKYSLRGSWDEPVIEPVAKERQNPDINPLN